MATQPPYFDVAYGFTQPLLNVFPSPIVSTRNPTTADKAQVGTIWVNKSSNIFYVLTSIANNLATWVLAETSGGTGVFSSVEATTGNITADLGNIVATAGSVSAGTTVHAGTAVTATTTVTAGTGITATTGNIVATAGAVNAGTTMTAGTGITSTTGNITALSGNVNVSNGDVIASNGFIEGGTIYATGDVGGAASQTAMTNVIDTAQSTGTLSIKSDSANPGNNAGFLKFYVGVTAVYVPYFTNIAP